MPTVTENQVVISSQSLSAGNTVTGDINLTNKYMGLVFGIVTTHASATLGVRVKALLMSDATPTKVETSGYRAFELPEASGEQSKSFSVPTGRWRISIENLDPTYAHTVESRVSTVDSN